MLRSIVVNNFRSIESTPIYTLQPCSVFFGPNGAGKTTILDAATLIKNCLVHGTTEAINKESLRFGSVSLKSASRMLMVGASADGFTYTLRFPDLHTGLSDSPEETILGNTEGSATEILKRKSGDTTFTLSTNGKAKNSSVFYTTQMASMQVISTTTEAVVWAPLISFIFLSTYFRSRHFDLKKIKQIPSERSISTELAESGENLWTVLKNLHDCRDTDELGWNPESRYDAIRKWTQKAFPEFRGWEFNNPPNTNYVFASAGIHKVGKVIARHLPDGLIQFTMLLTAMFCQSNPRQLILLDEPDLSLHPWALFVLAEAIQEATTKWNRQVLLATHSPVLLSQFPEESLFLMMPKDGETTIQRVSEMTENRDLLNQYSVGSLYMSQLIGEQSSEPMVTLEKIDD